MLKSENQKAEIRLNILALRRVGSGIAAHGHDVLGNSPKA
jgi:hypothetical protein